MFERILIANRGEIAVRIIRAAAGLGIETLAVYPDSDTGCLHTRLATDRRRLPGTGVQAYLDGDALLKAAAAAGCDGVHPGYGFLAENARFAERCGAAGLSFIGPAPAALALFGDKVRARALAQSLAIPIVPGSSEALDSAEAALLIAEEIGYPVMLKAAAGGGGRGMRMVAAADALPEAFARCASEARAAFGDGSLFLERRLERPRHIEVQVLGDREGRVTHLFDRDCSLQQRHQKVVEIAPAPALDPGLRERLFHDALKLVREVGYENAGTVEFLVEPETGTHAFIECNPRIQVEHTITEQITGIDLVEAQLRVAAGATLAELGLAEPLPAPQRAAVQLRVVARGAGTLSAWQPPTGPGVRVDSHAYAGYTPPPEFDPLLAKVIATSAVGAPDAAYTAALARALQALQELHLAGVPNNLHELRAMLALPAVRQGDARVTTLEEAAAALQAASEIQDDGALALLVRSAGSVDDSAAPPTAPGLEATGEQQPVVCPMAGQVVDVPVTGGQPLSAGDAVLVINAMKMETVVTAPCAGTLAALEVLAVGDVVAAGQIVALIEAGEGAGGDAPAPPRQDSWADVMEEVQALQQLARDRLAPGSSEPGVMRQRDRGKLDCRQRIEALLDAGSFREVGSLAGFASYDDQGRVAGFTPANHVGGWGTIDGRTAVVCADDFTSRGGHADGAIGNKNRHLDELSLELRVPSIRLLDGSSGGGSVAAMVPEQKRAGESRAQESSGHITAGRPRVAGSGGSFLPGHLGSTLYAEQLATVPVVNLLLGSVVGIGAAKAVLGHFSVMVRDIAQLFVAGPPVVRHAMGYDVSKEDLGDWRIHCRNGSVDNLAETEADAFAQTRRFLSYLPGSVYEPPPVLADADDDPARRDEELFTLIPRKRTTTFDMRRAITLMADRGSFFEIGPLWGTDQITGFVRFKGHTLGVIASDSRHRNGGALTADGSRKLIRHLDLCDLFHIPLLNLVDNPGFAVGIEHEQAGTIRAGGAWMIAFAQTRMPIFTVIMRRSFGVAGNNYATPRAAPSMRVVWPAADVGGIPPEGGIEAAYKRQLAEAEDPETLRAELMARIESARGPTGPLSKFQMEEMIDPRDTRRLVCEWVETAYRRVRQAQGLAPRALQFRP